MGIEKMDPHSSRVMMQNKTLAPIARMSVLMLFFPLAACGPAIWHLDTKPDLSSEIKLIQPERAALTRSDLRIVFTDLDNQELTSEKHFVPPSVHSELIFLERKERYASRIDVRGAPIFKNYKELKLEEALNLYRTFKVGDPGVFRVKIYRSGIKKPFNGIIVFSKVKADADLADRRVWRIGIDDIRFEQATGGLVSMSYQPINYEGYLADVFTNNFREEWYWGERVRQIRFWKKYHPYIEKSTVATWVLWMSDMEF